MVSVGPLLQVPLPVRTAARTYVLGPCSAWGAGQISWTALVVCFPRQGSASGWSKHTISLRTITLQALPFAVASKWLDREICDDVDARELVKSLATALDMWCRAHVAVVHAAWVTSAGRWPVNGVVQDVGWNLCGLLEW